MKQETDSFVGRPSNIYMFSKLREANPILEIESLEQQPVISGMQFSALNSSI
jgi:hypothetical protein